MYQELISCKIKLLQLAKEWHDLALGLCPMCEGHLNGQSDRQISPQKERTGVWWEGQAIRANRGEREKERDITPLLPHRLLRCRCWEMIRDRKTETDRARDTYKYTEHTQTQNKRHRERMGFLKQEKYQYEREYKSQNNGRAPSLFYMWTPNLVWTLKTI